MAADGGRLEVDHLEELRKAYAPPPPPPGAADDQVIVPVIRYRAPFVQTPRHDARGDAMNLFIENVSQNYRECPQWLSYTLAVSFVDSLAASHDTAPVAFDPEVYDAIDASVWCKKTNTEIAAFMQRVISGDVPMPTEPACWSSPIYSVHCERNRRPKQEDRWVTLPSMRVIDTDAPSDASIFAVFDGHGGAECATYAAAHLPHIAAATTERGEDRVRLIMEQIDARLSVRCDRENWRSGCTAVVAAVERESISLAWLGDSAALVLTNIQCQNMTRPHKPTDREEASRVEAAGGMLLFMHGELRVNGVLNLTRALGDIAGRPMICAECETRSVARQPDQYLLILACDGVSESLTPQQIYKTVEQYCKQTPVEEHAQLSAFICDAAKKADSSDNLTCICVFLRPPTDLWTLFLEASDDDEEEGEQGEKEEEKEQGEKGEEKEQTA